MTGETSTLRVKWRMAKARFESTWFWRVFGICAMRKLWTKFLVAVAIMAGFWSLFFGIEWLNPVLPLEQLTRNEGVLVHVYKPLRSAHDSKIKIQTDSGEEIAYRGSIYDEAGLLAAKGKRVTVWSQPYYELWLPFYYERFWQVQEGEQVLKGYEDSYKGRLRNRPNAAWLAKRLLVLTILSLSIVILACRKQATTE